MPRAPRPVRLVVLNYNGGALVTRCLAHLHRLDWPADELDLVLVDNASTDGSADEVERRFPRVRVIRNDRNAGFPANNLALTDLDDVRYVGLVNSDGFVEPGWLRALVEALDADPGLGAAAARMVFAPRFADLVIDTTATPAGYGDDRRLGVMITGVRVDGRDRWSDVQVAEGGWGVEHNREGPFRWTAGHAVVRIPVDPPPDAPGPDTADADGTANAQAEPTAPTHDPRPTVTVEIRLRADSPRKVTLAGAGTPEVVAVDGTARWYRVEVGGEPYDVVQNAGSIVHVDGAGADRGFGQRDDGRFDEPIEVFAWCGGSVLLRPEYVRRTGAFDERFFLYYEDTDWSWRGRAQGWRYRYVPGAVMRHVHAATSGEGSPVFAYHVERNRLLMLVKNAPARMAAREILRYGLITASYARRDVVGRLRRRQRPDPTVVVRRLRSFAGFLRLLPAMLADRRRLRARQTVPDEELLGWLVEHPTPDPEPANQAPPPDTDPAPTPGPTRTPAPTTPEAP